MKGRILLAGVGGQGVLFATRVLARCATDAGLPTMGSETHGMAQRGGSVVSHLLIGSYRSSLVRSGTADWLISFEAMETYRHLPFLRPEGRCYVNTPGQDFPDPVVAAALAARGITVRTVDASGLAARVGAPLAANLVLLGFIAAADPDGFGLDTLKTTVTAISPQKHLPNNLKALVAGAEAWK